MRAPPVVLAATDEHCVAIAPRLRLADCREIRVGADPLAIARANLGESSEAWTWIVDDRPAAMFGVVPRSIVGGIGGLWLLTTDDIRCDLRTFWLGSKVVVETMRARYAKLDGFVDARFTQSVRWLTRLGFRLYPPCDFGGVPFRYFTMER